MFCADQDTEHTPQRCQILDFLLVGRRMGPGTRFSNCDQISGKELWFHMSISATYRIGPGHFSLLLSVLDVARILATYSTGYLAFCCLKVGKRIIDFNLLTLLAKLQFPFQREN